MIDKGKTGHREKLRERFISGDKTAQTDEALLELLLTYAIPRKDVQPLAKQLIDEFGSLSNVLSADISTLCKLKGIQMNSAVLLKLMDRIRTQLVLRNAEQTPKPAKDYKQALLFDLPPYVEEPKPRGNSQVVHQKRINAKRSTGLFSNAVLKQAISLLPSLPETRSLEEVRVYLMKGLQQSSEQTRRRYANYIIRRMFPNGWPDWAMLTFAKFFSEARDFREVCFYRFIRAEPLMQEIVNEMLLSSLGNRQLIRETLRDYLANRFESSRNIKNSAKAIAEALGAAGIAEVDSVKISFSYRDIPIPAFAFILHSEFPEPGMYNLAELETNQAIRAMLWNPDHILPSLYELRNQRLISKISEIDNLRQFTTKWYLDELVEHLVEKGKSK